MEKLKVCLDLRMIAKETYFGTGQYVYNLIERLAKIVNFTMLLREEIGSFPRIEKNFSTLRVDTRGYFANPRNFLIEQNQMRKMIDGGDFDLYHATYNWGVPKTLKTIAILTVHDLIPIKNKADTTQESYDTYLLATETSIKRANKIITVSQNSKKDIIDVYNIDPEKIKVIYNGYNNFSKIAGSQKDIEKTLKKYKIREKFLIYSAGIGKRKNLEGVIETFNLVKKKFPKTQLVIVGDTEGLKPKPVVDMIKKIAENYKILDQIVFTGFITTEELANLVTAAEAMLYPSRYEGFGIPVLESMSSGTPIVISNRGALPEVGGDAAPSFEPTDYQGMAESLSKIITNQVYRKNLIKKGYQNIKKYSWDKMVKETYNLYKKVAELNK